MTDKHTDAVEDAIVIKEWEYLLSEISASGMNQYLDDDTLPTLDKFIRKSYHEPQSAELEKIPLSASTSGDYIAPDYIKGWNAAIEALKSPPVADPIPHKWDKEGEHCTVCGQSDWMAGGCRRTEPPVAGGEK